MPELECTTLVSVRQSFVSHLYFDKAPVIWTVLIDVKFLYNISSHSKMPWSPTRCPRMWQNIYIILHQNQMTELLPRKTVLVGHISGNALAQPCEYHASHTVALRGSYKKKGFLHNYAQSAPGFIHFSFLISHVGKSIGSLKMWCSRTNKFSLLYLQKLLCAIFSVYSCANGTAI